MSRFNQFRMKNLKTVIQKLLKNNVLVSPQQKTKISRDLDKYTKDQLDVLYSFLKEANTNQKTLVWNALKNNSKFEGEIEKSFVKGDDTRLLDNLMGEVLVTQKENSINAVEKQELANIEQELQNI